MTNPTHAQTVADIERAMEDLWNDTADLMGDCKTENEFRAKPPLPPFGTAAIHRICGNPNCVNGDHWRLVEAAENRRAQ